MSKLISNAALLGVIAYAGYWVFSWVDTGDTTLAIFKTCLLYTSPSPRDRQKSRMPSSA